jgi:hypothetical protein
MTYFDSTLNAEFSQSVLDRHPLDAALEWIRAHLSPEDVFDEGALTYWALDNDFAPKEDS